MNHYPHHIGDFEAKTRHLSRLERAIYRDMRDRYCLEESPLDGNDFNLLARRLLCVTPEDVAALQFVLDEFFELTPDGLWINHECDQIIAAYRAQQVGGAVVKGNEKDRKARSRARRSAMFSALRGLGLVLPYDTKMAELYRLCKDNQIPIPADGTGTSQGVTGGGTGHGQVTPRHALGTGKPEPEPKPLVPPNPPAGGAGDLDASPANPGAGAGQGGGVVVPGTATTTATALCAFFPERRRTRLAEVSTLIALLEAEGTVTTEQLLQAAAQQADRLGKDDGKACPSVLRWLREERWLDGAAAPSQVGTVPSDWRDSRSGVEAMGERLGLGRWDESKHRLFAQYEELVVAALDEQTATLGA